MKRVVAGAAGAVALVALAGGCSSSSGSSSASGSTATASPVSAAGSAAASVSASMSASASSMSASPAASGSAASVKAAGSAEGQILVDGSGRTLYLFGADTGSTSNCNGSCATAWPPDTTTGKPTSTGVNASLVGTSVRSDKATQVTYKGHPLYYFAGDSKPGETNGQGSTAFGGKWYVVSPSGNAITTATTPTSTPSTGGGGYGY